VLDAVAGLSSREWIVLGVGRTLTGFRIVKRAGGRAVAVAGSTAWSSRAIANSASGAKNL